MAHLLDLHESFDFPPEADVNKARSTLPPEIEEGNIEYKLKLINPSKTRLEHLTTQLKWRLQEGQGEAIYEIGVENNGLLAGLTREEMNLSLETLTKMAEKLGSEATVLREQIVEQLVDGGLTEENQKIVAEVLVRKVPDDQQFIDIRLAVLGNVDVGKSTILGVLTQGELDNGRGRARLNLFRHLHEIESGRTSSISHEILGFDSKGQVVNYSHSGSAEEICEVSSKIITFLDLAGHQKYLKTTIFGLTGHIPDFAMLVVAANAGVVGTFREHLGLCMALEVPMFIVINKTDICTPAMTERTMKSLDRVLKSPGCRKVVVYVQNKDDAIAAATNLISNKTTPIFTVSSVTGQNLDILKQFLNMIPPRQSQEEQERLMQEMPEYLVDETFKVPGTGLVVGGTLMRGVIREGDTMMLGPSGTGEYNQSKVMSIRRNRAPCRLIKAGQSATLALSGVDKAFIRRGMALLSPNSSLGCSSGLEASLFLLFHTSELTERFQGTLHVGKIVQRVVIKKISSQRLKTGQWATVTFEFLRNPEFIRTGSKIFFRQGRTKAMGTISRTIPYCSETIER